MLLKQQAARPTSLNMEGEPCLQFQQKFRRKYGQNHIQFQQCSLSQALKASCFADFHSRKMLALYLHHDDDDFSKVFCPLLADDSLTNVLEVYTLFLPWDITDCKNHSVIKKMISAYNELSFIEFRISQKKSALLLIAPIDSTITLFGILQGKVKKNEITEKVQLYCKTFEVEMNCEKTLYESKDEDTVKIDSKHYQQMMFDMLGDRDYDAFEKHQHDHLKEKIAFAFFGPPQSMENSTASLLDCYTVKQKEKIDAMYNKIFELYDKYAEYENQIIISFIYNCTEPLPQEKTKRLKEAKQKKAIYDPETDILPLPIFVLRKCLSKGCGDKNPCRIFIDHDLRVYTNWEGYIADNKLPACMMVLPKDGKYKGDSNGEVLLEYHLAPKCGIKADVLKGLDITSTVLGVGSGVIFATALIPTVAMAPVALIAAGIVGAGVGIYSLVRSAIQLADRHKHCEDMSLLNSEARGSYINIVAGSLGFVGSGATTVVSQLVAQGVNVGRAAQSAVTAVNVVNLSASGAVRLHSSYEIYIHWREGNVVPSALTILQLSSSVLFFGNARYNFRTGAATVEETHTKVLQEFQDGLRRNRHRKIFNKMQLETIRQNDGNVALANAEVIATIRRIPDQNEVFSILTRSNKIFNKNNVKFAAGGGKITLNGVSVDISQFGGLSKTDQTAFLLDLPPAPAPSPEQTMAITKVIKSVFTVENIRITTELATVPLSLTQLLNLFEPVIQEILLKCLDKLLNSIDFDIIEVFKKVRPGRNVIETGLGFIIYFFKMQMIPYEQDYVTRREDAKLTPGFSERDFASGVNATENTGSRALMFFERVVTMAFSDDDLRETVLHEMIQTFMKWLAEQIYIFEENGALSAARGRAREAATCALCGGYYYKK